MPTLADPLGEPAYAEIRRPVREFLDAEIAPRVAEYDRAGKLPSEVILALGRSGILTRPLPAEYGGAAAPRVVWAEIVEELGRVDTALRTFVTVQTDLVLRTLVNGGYDPSSETVRKIGTGEQLASFAFTEPDAGSDAGGLSSSYRLVESGALINGRKAWITNASVADAAVVYARPEGDAGGTRTISAFLVKTNPASWIASAYDQKLGMRSLDVADLEMRQAPGELLGKESGGWRLAMAAVDEGRLGVAAGSVGLSQACLEASIAYSHNRKQFGREVASFQLVQEMIADILVDITAGRELVRRAARLKDAGLATTADISTAKLFATEAADRCSYRAIQVHGSNGYSGKYPVERYFRDARGATLYQGTSQIQRLIIGREILGVNAIA